MAIVFLGPAVLLCYYLCVWVLFGKDRSRGVVMPLYKPPENVSPAVMRFLLRKEFDSKAFACAVMDLCVKGHLIIAKGQRGYSIKRTAKDVADLPRDEEIVFSHLMYDETVALHPENHRVFDYASEKLKNYLREKHGGRFLVGNSLSLVAGAVLSYAAIMYNFYSLSFLSRNESFWLSFALLNITPLGSAAALAALNMSGATRLQLLFRRNFALSVMYLVLCLEFLVLVGYLFVRAPEQLQTLSFVIFLVSFLCMVTMIGVFHVLLKRYSLPGGKVMNAIDGFRMFIEATEKDRLKLLGLPEQSPQLFERYLPFALALDLEHRWSDRFSETMADVVEEGLATYNALSGTILPTSENR